MKETGMKILSILTAVISAASLVILFINNQKLKSIMATIAELNEKVTDLQTSIDAKQQQISDAIAVFNKTIADLKAQIEAGGAATPEQLQTVVDSLESAKADLESTATE
jgi:uncharacterized protein (DUF3084 family)